MNFDTEAANELIVQSVRQHREMMPRIGSRKLYVLAQHELGSLVGFPERDRFIDLLASNDLLLKLRRRKRYKTTDSNHPYRRYLNLIKDLEFHGPNEGLFGVNQIRSLQKKTVDRFRQKSKTCLPIQSYREKLSPNFRQGHRPALMHQNPGNLMHGRMLFLGI